MLLELNEINAVQYTSFSSPDNFFRLQWTKNNKLIFKITCKTRAWCAVGFIKGVTGKNIMVNYDIPVAGHASGAGFIH